MSDPSTKWFKLWISALTDPDTSNLSNEKFAQWVKLGTYIKGHGDNGMISVSPPSTMLCTILQIVDFESLFFCISQFPNVVVRRLESDNASFSVTYLNWSKYQVDSTSYNRVKKFRESKHDNAVRGEKEKEEKKRKKREDIQAYIESLKSDSTYSHVDFEFELNKAKNWCVKNNRKLTERFFLNWINKIDKPLNLSDKKPDYMKGVV